MDKIDELLDKLIRKKKDTNFRHRNKRDDITTDYTDIKRIKRILHKLYANIFNNLRKWTNSLQDTNYESSLKKK